MLHKKEIGGIIKKLRKKIERVLSDNNVNQYQVLDLDLTDLDMLKAPFKKDLS